MRSLRTSFPTDFFLKSKVESYELQLCPIVVNCFDIKKGWFLRATLFWHSYSSLVALWAARGGNRTIRAAERPGCSAAVCVLRSQLERVRPDSSNNRNSGRRVEAGSKAVCHCTGFIGGGLSKISFLSHGPVSQVGFDLGLMTALSICRELRDCDRRQDTDDGDHHQQFNKRKT